MWQEKNKLFSVREVNLTNAVRKGGKSYFTYLKYEQNTILVIHPCNPNSYLLSVITL